jgi:predicted nuclease of restriction endonuclease-like (RecB) superfamily
MAREEQPDPNLSPVVKDSAEAVPAGDFDELLSMIEQTRDDVARAVNRELIGLYWRIGEHVSARTRSGAWGQAVIARFAARVQQRFPGISGFSPVNIWRMRTFYEAYAGNEVLSPLVKDVSWTNHILILAGAKTDEAREFYLRLTAANGYSKRELERQIDSLLYERTMLSDASTHALVQKQPTLASLRDSYVLEFLDLPVPHREADLRRAIVANLREFILEFGKDFAFVGEEYRLQVGNHDFFIDLLFFNRALSCLVAIELKVGMFKPEYVGQVDFYLEALDRDVRKPGENPSVGLILCTSKDQDVVEYALSRSLSPAMVAQYELALPDKAVLEHKLRELRDATSLDDEGGAGELPVGDTRWPPPTT